MSKKSPTQIISAPPEAIIYTQLKLPSKIPVGDSLSDELRKIILLEIQGEAVEVSEEYPLPILMAAFDVVHKVSPEMVLRLKNNKRVLIFDHWGAPVIRDEDIIAIDENGEYKKSEKFTPELVIDLESVWEKSGAQETDPETIKNALKEVKKSITPSMITTLVGKAPALLFLLTQHMLYGQTGEIWYQENLTSIPIRIAR